jgi:hypothetical protein
MRPLVPQYSRQLHLPICSLACLSPATNESPKHKHRLVRRMIPWGLFGRDNLRRSCSTLSHVFNSHALMLLSFCYVHREIKPYTVVVGNP